MIKQIWLDLGKVLVYFDERTEVLVRIVKASGGNTDTVRRIFGPGRGESVYEDLDLGRVSHEDLWNTICQFAKIPPERLSLSLFSALYVNHLRPILPTISLVARLQEKYHLVVVFNGDFGSIYAVRLLESHFGLRFQKVFISSLCQLKKPGLLNCALVWAEKRGSLPAECVFVDDVEAYINEANRLGVLGILYDATVEPLEEQAQVLERKLRACGVES